MKQFICTMVNFKGTFWLYGGLGLVQQHLLRIWANADYLVTLKKYIGYQKLNFPKTEKKILGTVFLIKLWIAYPNNVDEFSGFLETYRRKKSNYIENDLGENIILDKLIVGNCQLFDCFTKIRTGMCLNFSRHISDKTKLANDNVSDKKPLIFSWSLHVTSLIRILSSLASRYKHNYIPHCNLWINGLFF